MAAAIYVDVELREIIATREEAQARYPEDQGMHNKKVAILCGDCGTNLESRISGGIPAGTYCPRCSAESKK